MAGARTKSGVFEAQGVPFHVDEKYEVIRELGKGAYGVVVAARNKSSNSKVAIKRVSPMAASAFDARHTLREVRMLRYLGRHENVVSLKDLIVREREDALYVVMELVDTDLHRVIQSSQSLSEEHIQHLLFQLLRGLQFTHELGVIHRDLKPANLLVSRRCDLRISDFGLSRLAPEDGAAMTEHVVTRWYRAPELMLSADGLYTSAIDVWSVGCIMAEMLVRRPLFPGKDFMHQLRLIFEVVGTPDEDELDYVRSSEALAFVASLPKHRPQPLSRLFPSASAAAIDLLEGLLTLHPRRRISVEAAMEHRFFDAVRDQYPLKMPAVPTLYNLSEAELLAEEAKAMKLALAARSRRTSKGTSDPFSRVPHVRLPSDAAAAEGSVGGEEDESGEEHPPVARSWMVGVFHFSNEDDNTLSAADYRDLIRQEAISFKRERAARAEQRRAKRKSSSTNSASASASAPEHEDEAFSKRHRDPSPDPDSHGTRGTSSRGIATQAVTRRTARTTTTTNTGGATAPAASPMDKEEVVEEKQDILEDAASSQKRDLSKKTSKTHDFLEDAASSQKRDLSKKTTKTQDFLEDASSQKRDATSKKQDILADAASKERDVSKKKSSFSSADAQLRGSGVLAEEEEDTLSGALRRTVLAQPKPSSAVPSSNNSGQSPLRAGTLHGMTTKYGATTAVASPARSVVSEAGAAPVRTPSRHDASVVADESILESKAHEGVRRALFGSPGDEDSGLPEGDLVQSQRSGGSLLPKKHDPVQSQPSGGSLLPKKHDPVQSQPSTSSKPSKPTTYQTPPPHRPNPAFPDRPSKTTVKKSSSSTSDATIPPVAKSHSWRSLPDSKRPVSRTGVSVAELTDDSKRHLSANVRDAINAAARTRARFASRPTSAAASRVTFQSRPDPTTSQSTASLLARGSRPTSAATSTTTTTQQPLHASEAALRMARVKARAANDSRAKARLRTTKPVTIPKSPKFNRLSRDEKP